MKQGVKRGILTNPTEDIKFNPRRPEFHLKLLALWVFEPRVGTNLLEIHAMIGTIMRTKNYGTH